MEFKASPRIRFAPTPSGFLHLGNIVNLLLIYTFAKKHNLQLILRIDDLDATRFREEYVMDILDTIDFLKIDFDLGPRSISEFYQQWSQRHRIEHYKKFAQQLIADGQAYYCECSRKLIESRDHSKIYQGFCRNRKLGPGPQNSLRLKSLPQNEHEMGDFILWRKDDIPSYQLVTLIDDVDFKVSHIIRGEDLRPSTLAQKLLATKLGLNEFSEVNFLYHDLMPDLLGLKLSKGNASLSIKEMRSQGLEASDIYQRVGDYLLGSGQVILSKEDLMCHPQILSHLHI